MKKRRRAKEMISFLVILLRNTTWKCGRVERLAVTYLRKQLKIRGRIRIPILEMLQYFSLVGKQKSEFLDAIERLEKRRIIKIINL